MLMIKNTTQTTVQSINKDKINLKIFPKSIEKKRKAEESKYKTVNHTRN